MTGQADEGRWARIFLPNVNAENEPMIDAEAEDLAVGSLPECVEKLAAAF